MKGKRIRFAAPWVALTAVSCMIAVFGAGQSFSFFWLAPGYAQHVWGITSNFIYSGSQKGYLGGVAVLQNGDVIAAECLTNGTQLHRFAASPPQAVDAKTGLSLHSETTLRTAGGCGIALHPDGFIYSNMFQGLSGFGVAQINVSTGASILMGPPGNALGIAVDPVTASIDPPTANIVYAGAGCKPGFTSLPTCTLWNLNPRTSVATPFATFAPSQIGYVDGIAFDPTGGFLFLTNRAPAFELVVLKAVAGVGTLVQRVPLPSEPVGIGFHAASPKFVVTNNQDGTISQIDFAGDDYLAAPVVTQFANGGFRGDLMQAGPDGCLYVTQNGVRNMYGDDGDYKSNSIVQICGGFASAPGVTPDPAPAPSSLCGAVYLDANNNGIFDVSESGITAVTLNLSGTDTLDRPVTGTTTTATNGSYCFNNLTAGTYTISEAPPSGYLDGKDTQGAPGNGTPGNDAFVDIVLAAGYNGMNNNFGELLPSSLCGFVYVDTDNNGSKNPGEPGIAGVAMTLTGVDDLGTSLTTPMSTGADGGYCFGGLRPGTYSIAETQPAGYLDGKDTQGTPGKGTVGNDVFSNIALNQNVNGRNNNFGEMVPTPAISLVKKTNGSDNNSAPGRYVPTGSVVTWTYFVSNTGNQPLSAVAVVDDKIGSITCPGTTLAVGEKMTCTATGTAVAGQYTNIGTVTAQDALGTVVTASNPDNYFGSSASVTLVKKTNGTDNDSGSGPMVSAGATVTWTYTITNTGNSPLSNVAVTDDKVGSIGCSSTTLAAGATMTCTSSGVAVAGAYVNIGTVTAKDAAGTTVTASNPDRYFGVKAALTLVTKTNGTDSDTGTGPSLVVGSPVVWTYVVTNGSNSALSNIVVTDDRVGAVCSIASLAAGASTTCTKNGTATAGLYTNVGTVTAQDGLGRTISAQNVDHYVGVVPAAPGANPDSASTLENVAVSIPVLANDVSRSGGVLSITGIPTPPAHGTAARNGTSIVYTPALNFYGDDVFTYRITDGVSVATASVSVHVSRIGRFVVFSQDFTRFDHGASALTGDVGANLARRHGRGRDDDDDDDNHDHKYEQCSQRDGDHDGDDDDDDDHDGKGKDTVTVWFGHGATMSQPGSRAVGDTVRLDKDSSIYNLVANDIINRRSWGHVRGTTTSSMRIPFLTMPDFRAGTPGTQKVVVSSTTTLSPGRYNSIYVGRGATLILTGGLYEIRSLDIEKDGTVLFKSATELRVKMEVDGDKGAALRPAPGSGVQPSQIVIYVEGADQNVKHRKTDGDDLAPTVVDFGKGAVVQANIYAPSGTIQLKHGSTGVGSFWGKHVRIGKDAQVTLDSAFQ